MPNRSRSTRAAFSLIPAMLVVALCAACAFGLVAVSAKFSVETEMRITAQSARHAALAGTRIALADLQTYTGADNCATAQIDPGAPCGSAAVGVWHGDRVRREFPEHAALVSGRGIFAGTRLCALRDPERMNAAAEVPWETLGENVRFAYFVIDESQRASLAKRERDAHLEHFADSPDALMRLRQQTSRRTQIETLFKNVAPDSADFRKKIACAPDEKIFLAEISETESDAAASAAKEAFTLDARAVPADWQRRRLKIDFADENFAAADAEFSARISPEAAKIFARKESEFPHAGTLVATRPPTPAGTLGFFEHPFPLLAELRLHLGFFNPRSDGQHRARFHVTAKFWNPYPFPLLAHGDGRIGLFDVENLPYIRIANENTGGEILFSPSDFPVGRFGLVRQTPSDVTTNAYCRIFDASAQGLGDDGNACGLHAGEIFTARFPDPRSQPEGLSRNTGGNSWKYQKDVAKINKAPSGAKPGAWFHPAHVIRAESLPALRGANFLIRGDAGTLKQQTRPSDYAAPVFEFRNVPLPAFCTKISGAEYNREKAGDYDAARADVVWKIRLRAEDSDAMRALLETIEPRRGIFDFSVPAVRDAFEISALTGTAAKAEAEIGGEAEMRERSPLRDFFPNEHANAQAFPCASARIFDAPRAGALSVGALRHAAFEALPPGRSFGSAFPQETSANVSASNANAATAENESPNAIFDRAFFFSERKNPHHVPAGEKNALVSGAFNVNSENAEAWAMQLTHGVPAWKKLHEAPALRVAPAGNGKNLQHAIFTRPFSAQTPMLGAPSDVLSDAELRALGDVERERATLSQGVRELDAATARRLAETLVRLLRERRERGNAPFRSLAEFFDSGILRDAICESRVNFFGEKEIPTWFPAAISQEALAEALAPCAVPRGDTFSILCRAEILCPISGKTLAVACAETRVQRMPEFFDATQAAETSADAQNALNRAFGRRYKICAFRWIPADRQH